MRKEKNTDNLKPNSAMKVIETPNDQSYLEFEIERHVKSIKALIPRLRPKERQRYYDGLLSHILSQPVDYPNGKMSKDDSYDFCNLSFNELSLIKELSVKVHELYRISESDAGS